MTCRLGRTAYQRRTQSLNNFLESVLLRTCMVHKVQRTLVSTQQQGVDRLQIRQTWKPTCLDQNHLKTLLSTTAFCKTFTRSMQISKRNFQLMDSMVLRQIKCASFCIFQTIQINVTISQSIQFDSATGLQRIRTEVWPESIPSIALGHGTTVSSEVRSNSKQG